MYISVKNRNGTAIWKDPFTGERSWLDYWEKHKRVKVLQCSAKDCRSKSNLVGAHVQKMNGGNEIYIVPLCRGCNNRTDTFEVDSEMLERVPSGL